MLALGIGLWACGGGGGGDATSEGCRSNNDCTAAGTYCDVNGQCAAVDGDAESDAAEQTDETRILRVSPGSALDFNNVQMSQNPQIPVTLYNDGNSTIHLNRLAWNKPTTDNPFLSPDFYGATIQGGQSYTFNVEIRPNALGEVNGQFTLVSDADSPYTELVLTTHAVVIQDSGTAAIGTQPTSITFDDQAIGLYPMQRWLSVGNTGTGSSQIILTKFSLQSQGSQPFTVTYTNEGGDILSAIDAANPLILGAKESLSFTVNFDPRAVGTYSDKILFEYHSDSDILSNTLEVPISGKGVAGAVLCLPSTVNFDLVPVGQTKTTSIRLINALPDTAVSISGIQPGTTAEQRSAFVMPSLTYPISIPAGGAYDFDLGFRPAASKSYNVDLQIATNYNGQVFYFPIKAEGTTANQAPIARMALDTHGADIETALTLNVGSSQTFYGDISYDPDGNSNLLTYEWSLLKPNGSTTYFVPNSAVDVNESVLFDVAGDYTVTLVVTDALGMRSDPKAVNVTASAALSQLRIEMRTSGISGYSDADLTWTMPSGTSCNESNVNANGTCPTMTGEGSVLVAGCRQASICTTESITHTDAPTGVYEARVAFTESCPAEPNSLAGQACSLSIGLETLTYDLYFYVNGSLFATINNQTLSKEGDTKTWRIVNNGSWQQPVEE